MSEQKNGKRNRGRMSPMLLLLAALVLLGLWLARGRCGRGWGLGGGGDTTGLPSGRPERPSGGDVARTDGDSPRTQAPPCEARLSSDGLQRNGRSVTLADLVSQCRAAGSVNLTVTGDARFGEMETLRASLADAGLRVFVH